MSSEQSILSARLQELAFDLHANGIQEIFGVIGDPVTPLVAHAEKLGIKYFAFRNEQAASYASSAVYFLKQRLAVTLTVAGPGFTNALSGMGNATVNGWGNILICPLQMDDGKFQAIDQISCLKTFFKGYVVFAGSGSVKRVVDMATEGCAGAVCMFVPVGVFSGKRVVKFEKSVSIPKKMVSYPILPPKSAFVIGSQMVFRSDLFTALLSLITQHQIPFLPESLARGIIPEPHPLCMTAARRELLRSTDCLVFLGGRVDWMWKGIDPKTKIYSFGTHDKSDGSLDEFFNYMDARKIFQTDPTWKNELFNDVTQKKLLLSQRLLLPVSPSVLPSHWQAIGAIKHTLQSFNLTRSLIVTEGANTMDVARVALDQIESPRLRMDAGKWGTMGGALGYILAATQIDKGNIVFGILGDSAFGFAGMELETLVRYKSKAVIFILNNGGIYTGMNDNATRFNPAIRHDKLMEAVGGKGFSTRDGGSIGDVIRDGVKCAQSGNVPVLVEICIDPNSGTVSGSLSRM